MVLIDSLLSPATSVYASLEVVMGRHRGGTLLLESEVCRVGASHQADVVLSDEGVAAEHVVLRFYAGTIAIEAVGGDVRVGDEAVVQGTGMRTRLPLTLGVGGACLHLARPELSLPPALNTLRQRVAPLWPFLHDSVQWGRQRSRAAMLACQGRVSRAPAWVRRSTMMAVACSMVGVIGIYQLADADKPAGDDGVVRSSVEERRAGEALSATSAAEASLESPAQALAQALKEAGLEGLRVRDARSHLVVSGVFAPEQQAAWQSVQRWFDQRYGSREVLVSEARSGADPDRPDFRFQAVWLGDHPYVIGAQGERLYPGAAVSEGWVLAGIAGDRITLRRGSDEMSLTL